MRCETFRGILSLLALAWACSASGEILLEPELMSSFDELTRALKGPPTLSCDLSWGAGPTNTPRPKKAPRSRNPIFNQVPNFALTIQGPFPRFEHQAEGSISYRTFEGKIVQMPVELLPRGQARRTSYCPSFPPFKIVLPKNAPGAVFNRSDRDLKVVTHCYYPPSQEENEKVLREYTLYRVLEASGLYSFLVQLVDATYLDPEGNVTARGPAFLIENLKDAQKRFYGTKKNPINPRPGLEGELELAEWLIGNTDFTGDNMGKNHNLYKIANPRTREAAYLPYDFDLSSIAYIGNIDSDLESVTLHLSNYGRSPDGRRMLGLLINRKAQMLEAVAQSPINEASRKVISDRIRNVVTAARKVLNGENP